MLDGFDRFNNFIKVGLIHKSDVEPYLTYWLKEICMIPKDPVGNERKKQLHRYIRHYKFDGVLELFERFGYELNDNSGNGGGT